MRTLLPAATALLALLAAPALAADAATVTLRVAPEGFVVPSHWLAQNQAVWIVDPIAHPELTALPGVAGCVVAASDQAGDGDVDGGDVLDAAAAAGCISGWSSQPTGFGTMVTSIDGLDQQGGGLATWWLIQVNGFGSPVGIDDLSLADGASLDFVHYAGPL